MITELAPDIVEDVHFIAKPFFPRDIVQRVNEILNNTEICTLSDDETETAHA